MRTLRIWKDTEMWCWVRVRAWKAEMLSYSFTWKLSLWKVLQPSTLLEWSSVKRTKHSPNNTSCGSPLCFQPQYHPPFLLPLGGSQAAEQWHCCCSVPWRGKGTHLSPKHSSPAHPKALHRGGYHRPAPADEQLSPGDEVSCSQLLAGDQQALWVCRQGSAETQDWWLLLHSLPRLLISTHFRAPPLDVVWWAI